MQTETIHTLQHTAEMPIWKTRKNGHLRFDPVGIDKLSIGAAHKEGGLQGVLQVEAGVQSTQVPAFRPGQVHHTCRPPLHLFILPFPAPYIHSKAVHVCNQIHYSSCSYEVVSSHTFRLF